jgi:hypothetical protein
VPVHVTDFPVVKVHVDELSARIWQHKLRATKYTTVFVLLDISEIIMEARMCFEF